ncbi:DNA recombination and repair protein RecO [Pseudoalteromonas luteoviolacea B = ATCC 29581]|nr:DNA recombination and repair protein RecO [Pseudoalteromonas luteoviolacea B = ATCC 29581]
MDSDFARAYLLHRRPVSDSSVMLNVVVEGIGHIKMLARIKGKQHLKQNAQLQPFTPLLCRFTGRHEVKYLNQFELLDAYKPDHGKRLYCGFYLNELSYRLMPINEPLDDAFSLYELHLKRLCDNEEVEVILRNYEFELLNLLGFGIEFDVDATGQPIKPALHYGYLSEVGFVPEQGFYQGKVLMDIAANDFSDVKTRQQAKLLSRQVLRPLLGYKELKSRELFISR